MKIFLLILCVYSIERCNKELVSSYGFEGLEIPQKRQMLLCEQEMSCCTLEDELKFHKHWNDYYKIKAEKIFDVLEKEYEKMEILGNYFQNFDLSLNVQFIKEIIKAEVLIEKIKENLFLDAESVKSSLREIKNKDLMLKEQFPCMICSLESQMKFTLLDQKYTVTEEICQNVVGLMRKIIGLKIQADKMAVLIRQFFGLLDFYEQKEDDRKILQGVFYAEKCLQGEYDFQQCNDLCSFYSFSNVSRVFFGDIEFYKSIYKDWKYVTNYIQNSKRAEQEALQAQINIEIRKQAELKKQEEKKKAEKTETKTTETTETTETAETAEKEVVEETVVEDAGRILSEKTFKKMMATLVKQYLKEKNRKLRKKKAKKVNKKTQKRVLRKSRKNVDDELNFATEQEAIDYIKEHFDPANDLDPQQQETIANESLVQVYEEIYERASRGPLSQFDDDSWLKNFLFEGQFLENFQLSFSKLGSPMKFVLSEFFTKPKADLIEEVNKRNKEETQDVYDLNGEVDSEILDLVREFSKEDIQSLIYDIEKSIGQNQQYFKHDFINYLQEQEEDIKQRIESLKSEDEEKQVKETENQEKEVRKLLQRAKLIRKLRTNQFIMNNQALTNSAVGIDFGSSRFIVAVVKKGGVEIVSNESNYRSTPSIVSYGKQRHLGESARANIKQNLKNSVFYPGRYLGSLSQDQLNFEKKFNYSKVQLNEEKPIFDVLSEGERIKVSAEQACAGLFTNALKILKLNHIESNDFVVSVPSYFTAKERQALIDAAQIAGIKLLRVYNESSANVMNYGIFRKADLVDEKPRLVAFVDYGYSKSSVFLAHIWKNKAEILYEKNDRNLGIRNIDYNLLQHYVQVFDQKNKIDLYENPKSIYRLNEAIERQRKILSGNDNAPLNIECIYEDFDINENCSREQFEQMNSNVFQQFRDLIKSAVAEMKELTKCQFGDLHSVERIGGGTRIPLIETIIQEEFGIQQISKTLDASESISRGCAIQSAMLSPRYHVATYNIKELSYYPINIQLAYGNDQPTEKTLFNYGTDFNKILSLSIKKTEPLNVQLVQKGHHDQLLLQAQVEAMRPKEEKFEGKISFELDKHGLVTVKSVEMTETVKYQEKVAKKKEEKKEENKEEVKEENKMEIEEDFDMVDKTKVVTSPLTYNVQVFYGLEGQVLQNYTNAENHFKEQERIQIETSEAKYNLESMIYKTREQIDMSHNGHLTTSQEKEHIHQALNNSENWLYEEGMHNVKEVYVQKLSELQQAAKPFYSRFNKLENMKVFLNEATPATDNFLNQHKELLVLGSDVEQTDIQLKVAHCQDKLREMAAVLNNFSIQSVDSYDYEKNRQEINQSHSSMNHILKEIEKRKKQKEKEERERKEKEEREKKEQEKKEKERQEQEKKEAEKEEEKKE